MSSNVSKWDAHYTNMPYIMPMGDSPVYQMGAEAFARAGCEKVEDWGCGYGWMEIILGDVAPKITYVGVDGSNGPTARVIDDLATRRSEVDGIFMRSVLEHNYNWETLLDNALASFTKLFFLALFTPLVKGAKPWKEIQFEDEFDVPTLSLNADVLHDHLADYDYAATDVVSPNTAYGQETIITIEKR